MTNENRKMHVTLSMPCDTENLPERRWYFCCHFTEVSTAIEADGASIHSQGFG